jgi:phospholipid-binding lipoprotein MlaA
VNTKALRLLGTVVFALILSALAGCATTANNPRDPLEGFNRAMFSFNDALDGAIMKPVAQGYQSVLPPLIRAGVSNFFSNVDDVWEAVNNALQGKIDEALQDVMRFAVNTVMGLGGILDIASDMGLQKHNEDFGQTLGKWGVGSGPYLVLPFFGPSSLRDGGGLLVDWHYDPVFRVSNVPARNTLITARAIDTRAELLGTTDVLEQAALDKYTFVRDAFFQYRRSQIYDGNAPREDSGASLDADEAEPKSALAPSVQPEAALAPSVSVATPAVAVVAANTVTSASEELARPAAVYTVFADGVALKTPKAEPEPAAAVSVVRFADDVVLQSR